MIHIDTGIYHSQAYGCWLLIHIGSLAMHITGRHQKPCLIRFELFTPARWFRFSCPFLRVYL